MFCRKCGKQIPDDSEFCFKCGVRVLSNSSSSEPVECRSTVSEKSSQSEIKTAVILDKSNTPIIKDGARVCPKCGNKLSAPWCVYCGEDFSLSNTEGASTSDVETSQAKPTVNNTKGDRDSSVYSTLPPKITPRKCDGCGELVYNNQRSCHNCGATNPSYSSRFDNSDSYMLLKNDNPQKSNDNYPFNAETATQVALQRAVSQTLEENRIKDSNTPAALVNVNIVTKIICIAAIAIALFLELVIAQNMDVSTYDGVMNHNSVIYVSYFFYGIFFLGLVVRIICAFIIAGMRGELGGIGTFVVVGLIITIIAGAISHSWMACFILFGLIAVAYVGSKIRDWM